MFLILDPWEVYHSKLDQYKSGVRSNHKWRSSHMTVQLVRKRRPPAIIRFLESDVWYLIFHFPQLQYGYILQLIVLLWCFVLSGRVYYGMGERLFVSRRGKWNREVCNFGENSRVYDIGNIRSDRFVLRIVAFFLLSSIFVGQVLANEFILLKIVVTKTLNLFQKYPVCNGRTWVYN